MTYLAEFYVPRQASVASILHQARAGVTVAARTGADVQLIGVILVPSDENCFALYLAGSAEEAATAGTLAGFTFDRVTEAQTAP
jgi:hypothetical protein